jgi:DNA-binding transcriptional LysR family regulator
MHFKGLDLNLLVALDVLFIEKNTTRAGERLGLSQSAVSGALARLREYFNDDLLVQAGRTFVLTPRAESLVEPVREVLRQVETTIATQAQFLPGSSTRRFTVVGSDYAMTILMTAALQRAAHIAPGVSFALRSTTNTWQEELATGAVDLVLIPEFFASDHHPKAGLFKDDFTCVVDARNALVAEALSPEQYFAMGHVGVAFGPSLNPSIEQWLIQKHGHRRRVEVFAPNFTLLPNLVIGTNRIATMHTRLARLAAQSLPLRLLPLPIEISGMVETMQWPAHHTHEPGSLWLRNLLQETAEHL